MPVIIQRIKFRIPECNSFVLSSIFIIFNNFGQFLTLLKSKNDLASRYTVSVMARISYKKVCTSYIGNIFV